ncbi:MAG TPA: septal ring lytic transglycosylase RlpA family protein [Solirubrobacteraceae bacterium]|nr:septal ring lytic transglycosylase RlpA family protein [Solirubrobacteraceae bacterium]
MPTAIRWAVPGLCIGLLSLPAGALASANGGAIASPPKAPSIPAGPTATGGALAVTPSAVLQHQVAVISGSVPLADVGHPVWLQVRHGRHSWIPVLSAAAAPDGSFAISWRADRAGRLTLRVVASGVASTSAVTATPQVTLSVYSQVLASWYGPGLYGNRTACGEKLTRTIVGLADRTLPCGTAVTLRYNGRTLTLPVIDRGPYANSATIDLTDAAAQELGVTETVDVGMLALNGAALAPTDWYPPASSSPTGSTGAAGPTGISTAGGATAPGG